MGAVVSAPPIRVILKAYPRRATAEPPWVRWLIIGTVLGFINLFLVLPLALVFAEALSKGIGVYLASFRDEVAAAAIRLTLITAAITVPLNTLFGLSVGWLVSRFAFKGRAFLASFIELPLWVSPVIGGLIYVLLFGAQGLLPPSVLQSWFAAPADWSAGMRAWPLVGGLARWFDDPRIIFAPPGIVIATIFVTFPFVARAIIPLMQAQGQADEEAALTLGASGWQIFVRVTLPKIRWALIYGMILCNARAMGEFGAVSVVSGHIRGETNTMPLHVEILYNEYQMTAAFALASLLSLLALVTLGIKAWVEARAARALREAEGLVPPAQEHGSH